MLIHHFLEYYARNIPASPCLTLADHTVSYGEVDKLSNRLANGLLSLGVIPGQRVAILGENSIEHLLLIMACSKTGAVAVSLNYRLAPAELAFILKDADTRVMLMLDAGLLGTLAQLRQQLPAQVEVLARSAEHGLAWQDFLDRKSTRLNSSHDQISYAVFCLKKKKPEK